MTELAIFPLKIQEPANPHITELSNAEAAQLASDLAALKSVRGDAALCDLRRPLSRRWTWGSNDHMLNVLENKIVVDLGCGIEDHFRQLLLAKKIGAYVGVDFFLDTTDGFSDLPIGKVCHLTDEINGKQEASMSMLIQGELLDVVSRLPSESCSFALNGIDDFIVDSSSDYGRELIKQIHRATTVGGYVMGVTTNYGVLSEFGERMGYQSYLLPSTDNIVHYERHQRLI